MSFQTEHCHCNMWWEKNCCYFSQDLHFHAPLPLDEILHIEVPMLEAKQLRDNL